MICWVLITISFLRLGWPVQNGLPENSSHLYTRCKPTRLCIVAELWKDHWK